jgi:hypothetical protein
MQSDANHEAKKKGEKTNSRLRVQLEFSEDAFLRLEALRQAKDAPTRAEVIRSALRIYEWLLEQSEAERIIEVQEKDGRQVARVEANWFLKL